MYFQDCTCKAALSSCSGLTWVVKRGFVEVYIPYFAGFNVHIMPLSYLNDPVSMLFYVAIIRSRTVPAWNWLMFCCIGATLLICCCWWCGKTGVNLRWSASDDDDKMFCCCWCCCCCNICIIITALASQLLLNTALYDIHVCHNVYCNITCSDDWFLTPSTPAVANSCCSNGPAPYWSNAPFLIFDIRALWRSVLSARAHECQKLKMAR